MAKKPAPATQTSMLPGQAPGGEPSEPLHIIELRAENFKRLKAITIRPDGAVIEITGRNGQGKTSVLDAVAAALGGKDHVPAQPIRRGESAGMVAVNLGALKIERHFKLRDDSETKYTDRLVVEFADGSRPRSPQAVLDELVGQLGFDPLEFTRRSPAEQFETLRQFVPGVDFDAIEAQNSKDYDERTAVGRRLKEEEAAANAIEVPLGVPEKPIDVSALAAELEAANATNADIARRQANREQAAVDIDRWNTEAEQLRAKASAFEKQAADKQAALDGAGELPAKVNTAALTDALVKADTTNAKVRLLTEQAAHRGRAREFKAIQLTLTKAIDARKADMEAKIAAAKMPIKGLGFGDKAILLNGVPFEQASGAEQLQASTAIAMALNPNLRAILIRDGSLLDANSLKMMGEIAADNGFQIFLERVSDGERVGVVIEDGEVVP